MKISAKPTSHNTPDGTTKSDNCQRICRNTAGQITNGDKIWQMNRYETDMKTTYKKPSVNRENVDQVYFLKFFDLQFRLVLVSASLSEETTFDR